jgi:hypothetical protein
VQARPGSAVARSCSIHDMRWRLSEILSVCDFTRVNDCIKLNACSHARASQLLANHSLHSVCALRAWALCSAGLGASLAASKSISYYHMGQYITVVSLKRAVRYARVMVGIPGALHYLLSEASYVMAPFAAIAVASAAIIVISDSVWFVS